MWRPRRCVVRSKYATSRLCVSRALRVNTSIAWQHNVETLTIIVIKPTAYHKMRLDDLARYSTMAAYHTHHMLCSSCTYKVERYHSIASVLTIMLPNVLIHGRETRRTNFREMSSLSMMLKCLFHSVKRY